jgi:putative hydrolase of the HAD superfamily
VKRAAFFDVAGTLIRPFPSVGSVYSTMGRRHGYALEADATESAFHTAWKALKKGPWTSSDKEWWRALVFQALASMGQQGTEEYFEDVYAIFAEAEAWRVLPDAHGVLRALHERGFHLGVISNWDERLRPLLARLDLDGHFDSITISCEVGAEKPDARIFAAGLQAAGVEASAAWHVGDSLEQDVRGAQAAGMNAFWIGGDNDLLRAVDAMTT